MTSGMSQWHGDGGTRKKGQCRGTLQPLLNFSDPRNAHSSPGLFESLWLKLLLLFNKDLLSDVRSVIGDMKIRKTWSLPGTESAREDWQ